MSLKHIVDNAELKPIPHHKGHPYILLDGRLSKANNVLTNIAIGRAAHEVHGLNVAYVCFRTDENHHAHQLFEAAGIRPLELGPYAEKHPTWFKAFAKLRSYLQAAAGVESVLHMRVRGVAVGDYIYDSIKKAGSGIYTYEDASFERVRETCERAIRATRREFDIHRDIDVKYIVVSHRTYVTWGIPARVALHTGATVISKRAAHLRRINSIDELGRYDFVLSLEELDDLIRLIGMPRLKAYGEKEFGVTIAAGNVNSTNEKALKQDARALRIALGAEKKPLAVIAAHCFSDSPHCDRDMIYEDYYQWFNRLIELTSKITNVRWAVKRHPHASRHGEEGVIDGIVSMYDHVELIGRDVEKATILQAADAVVCVRSAVAVEALLFDCRVVLAGNAWYDSIESIEVYQAEEGLRSALRSIERGAATPGRDKVHAPRDSVLRRREFPVRYAPCGYAAPALISRLKKVYARTSKISENGLHS